MIRARLALPTLTLSALLLAGTACTAQTPAGAPARTAAADRPQPAGAEQPVPRNSPLEPGIRNVAATTGRANLTATPPPATVTEIGRFDEPFAMAVLPDGSLLVTQKAGQLVYRHESSGLNILVNLQGVPVVSAGGQGGLLDVAIAPDFATSRIIYLSYAEPRQQGSSLALMRARFDRLALTDQRVIWRSGSAGPGGQFGATIAFAPDGKSLFLTSGERQRFTPAQDPDQLLGKIVHLTLDGRPAPGNPFPGRWHDEIWSSGHRNPYGLVFTRDGRLWEEEMGPRGGDELNLIERGRNYGWPIVSNGDNYSGQPIPDHPSRPDLAAPALWWNPSISPGGMIEYRGKLFPGLDGTLLIAALGAEGVAVVRLEGARATPTAFWAMNTRIRDVAEAPDGAILLLEDGDKGSGGRLLRLTPKG